MKTEIKNKVVIFDSNCVLCNSAVKFIFRMNSKKNIYYSYFNSEYFNKATKKNLIPENCNSVIFINDNNIFYKSDAVLYIAKELKFPVKYFYYFKLIPKFIRDKVYDLIAKHRFKIFGKTDLCKFNPDLNSQILH